MRLRFFGAAGEVTGSCYLLETTKSRLLIDFGIHQGSREADRKNARVPPMRAKALDGVILTHAHLDHCGRLPLLPLEGYDGPIHATPSTAELVEILLRDSAGIQMEDAERESRKRRRAGRPPVRPLYDTRDVEKVLPLFKPLRYGERREVAEGVTARLVDAGHIIGSASVELTVREDGQTKVIVFSGDIGPRGSPLLRDPVGFEHADVVVLESTYGDRDHRPLGDTLEELAGILRRARTPEGKVLVPAFAVGRTQNLIYWIGQLERDGKLERPRVVIDSPMATKTTELYRRHRGVFDEAAQELIESSGAALDFEGLRFTRTIGDSKSLNDEGHGIVVIAGSGMCTGGRILHHFKHGLWKPEVHVVIVGYQAEGTLGRRLVEGEKKVRVFGETVAVKAQIHTVNGLSAHAGQSELAAWAGAMKGPRPRVFLTHGENPQRSALAARLEREYGMAAAMPEFGEIVEI